MPLSQQFNAFLGAAVLGVIGAAGLFVVEHLRQEKRRHAMAKDLARLDHELGLVKRELHQLLVQKEEKVKLRKSKNTSRAKSIISQSTENQYFSSNNLDSSDLEFYDLSDDEADDDRDTLANAIGEIDRKLNEGTLQDLENCLTKLKDLCMEHPENVDLLWRIAKAHHRISEQCSDKSDAHAHINKGVEACESALNLSQNSSDIHKWTAILLGSRSDFQTIQDKISDGHRFKSHIDQAIKLNPTDPTLHYLLGRFDYEVAGMKWYERKVAAAFFGQPPTATYEDALSHFNEAESLNYNFKDNKLMIAKCKLALGEYKEGVEWLEKIVDIAESGIDDKTDIEAKTLLEKYNSYR